MSSKAFADAAQTVGCTVVEAPDAAAARALVVALIGDDPALVDSTSLGDLGVPAAGDKWAARVGVSEAFSAAAESGTVALVHGLGAPRGTAVLPAHHVIVVPASAIVATYQAMTDAVVGLFADAAARGEAPPSGVQYVSGPSRSGDIESAMIKGMHGPRRVTLVVVG